MELRRLEYLTALAREEHFGRAAEACHVTQPALSSAIRKLERELGVQVVRRGQRFEGLTAEGEQVLAWAQRVLADRARLDQTLAVMRDGLSGTLAMGAIPTALSMASLLTTPLGQRHPLVRFRLESMSSREIVARLNDLALDVGMTYVDGEPLGRVRTVPLYRERYLLLCPSDGALAAQPEVLWADAAGARLSLLTSDMQNRRIVDGHLADTGLTPDVVVETDTVSAIYAHVVSMGLASIVPHTWLPTFGVPAGVCARPLPAPGRAHHVGLVLAGHGPESLLAQALVEVARGMDLDRTLEDAVAQAQTSTRSAPA